MSQSGVNPYPIGTLYSAGLDYVIANITTADLDDIAAQVTNYVNSLTLLPSTTSVQLEIKSVCYSAINSYVNGMIKGNNSSLYNGAQNPYINKMSGSCLTCCLPVASVLNRILDIEDNIPKSGLTVLDQTPLFLAIMFGKTTYTYFLSQINLIGAMPGPTWNSYLGLVVPPVTLAASQSISLANLPYWTVTSMEGALIGANSTERGMIETTIDIVTVQIVSALTAALMLTSCKVILQTIPRVQGGGLNNNLSITNNCGCNIG